MFGLHVDCPPSPGLRVASKFGRVASYEFGLRVASSNLKVGLHTDTTKYGLCTTWVKFGLDAKSV